jgi:hypothetical protein
MSRDAFQLVPDDPVANAAASMGGNASAPAGTAWPRCKLCGDELILFFQIRLPDSGGRFIAGSLLQVFACREHDDIAGTIYSDYRRFDELSRTSQLPDKYWEVSDGHYLLRLLSPGENIGEIGVERRLAHRSLKMQAFAESENNPAMSLKLFGNPSWCQDPEPHQCACGSTLELLLQIPEGTGFDMAVDAEPQPNSFSNKQYCLFLGNELYLLGCTKQCNPLALLPVLQAT